MAPTIPISALTGQGTDELLKLIEGQLFENYTAVTVHIPYRDGQLISLFHEQGKVESMKPKDVYITIEGMLPTRMLYQYRNYFQPPPEPAEDGA